MIVVKTDDDDAISSQHLEAFIIVCAGDKKIKRAMKSLFTHCCNSFMPHPHMSRELSLLLWMHLLTLSVFIIFLHFVAGPLNEELRDSPGIPIAFSDRFHIGLPLQSRMKSKYKGGGFYPDINENFGFSFRRKRSCILQL